MKVDEDGRIYVVKDRACPLNVNGKIGVSSFWKTHW
jgi:hypothetical protein